jgi:hypothetical protein
MEEEAGSPPQAQEKKDEGSIVSCIAVVDMFTTANHFSKQINTSYLNLT